MKHKEIKSRSVKAKGFTFLEVIVAVFIFALMMVAATAIFAKAMKAYSNTKVIQRDMESAQYAMNLMAKTIRTSSVIVPSPPPTTVTRLVIYDYSQGKCIEFKFETNKLVTRSIATSGTNKSNCDSLISGSGSANDLVGTYTTGRFSVIPSEIGTVGRVTISMEVCPATGCSGIERDKAIIQSTVSLRDYIVSGL